MGINLLAGVRKVLNGEFFETLTQPVESRRRAVIFEREHQIEALLGRHGVRCVLRPHARWEKRGGTVKRDKQGAGNAVAHLMNFIRRSAAARKTGNRSGECENSR